MDPAMEKTQSSIDVNTGKTVVPEQARQFIASESGRIKLAEGDQTLRRSPACGAQTGFDHEGCGQ